MGVNLSIKGVPDELAEVLRQRAARNHRSLQGELMAILEAAAREAGPGMPAEGRAVQALPDSVQRLLRPPRGTRRIEDLVESSRSRSPRPITDFGSSVDIIRQMRDER